MRIEDVTYAPEIPEDIALLIPAEPVRDPIEAFRDATRTRLFRIEGLQPSQAGDVSAVLARAGQAERLVMLTDGASGLHSGQAVMAMDEVDWPRRLSHAPGYIVRWAKVPGTERQWPIDVPLLRLHRPQEPGCKASYALGRETVDGGSVKFTLGINVGGETSFTAKTTETYTATENCIEVVVPATLAYAEFSVLVNEEEVGREWDARVVDVRDNVRDPRPVPRERDRCNEDYARATSLSGFESWDLRGTSDPEVELTVGFDAKTVLNLGLDLDLGAAVPLKIELGIHRESTISTEVVTTVVRGRMYAVYEPGKDQTMERCWTVA